MESAEKVFEAFYIALNDMFVGKMDGMKNVWSQADDISYVGPQGDILVGRDKVIGAFQAQADLNLKGHIDPEDIHTFIHGDIAMIQNYEVGKNEINGQEVQVKIRAMSLFRKEKEGWKMVSHQSDLLPFLN